MQLLVDLTDHLNDMPIDWYLCGGFAIDAYLGYQTRPHKDLDITVSFRDQLSCIRFLQAKGWHIIAPVGNQRFVDVDVALLDEHLDFDNIWCFKGEPDFIKTELLDETFTTLTYLPRNQTSLDFIEVLFNKIENDTFYYLKNPHVTLGMNQAIINRDHFFMLAPEVILLYKSRNVENLDYERDFLLVMPQLEPKRAQWFRQAMNLCYPNGHPWLNL